MPRYHFNLHDHRFVPDPEGSELPNLEMAKRQAIKLAASHSVGAPRGVPGFVGIGGWK